jgi:hypothetical protein
MDYFFCRLLSILSLLKKQSEPSIWEEGVSINVLFKYILLGVITFSPHELPKNARCPHELPTRPK